MVRIVGVGEATIYVDYQGQRATRRIRTTVRYDGRLDTSARATGCLEGGVYRRLGACLGWVGSTLDLHAVITQDGSNVVAVTEERGVNCGVESVDAFPAVTATIEPNGELRFHSTREIRVDGVLSMKREYRWILRPVGLAEIGGTVVFRVATWDDPGFGYLEAQTTVVPVSPTRPASAAATADPGERVSGVLNGGRTRIELPEYCGVTEGSGAVSSSVTSRLGLVRPR